MEHETNNLPLNIQAFVSDRARLLRTIVIVSLSLQRSSPSDFKERCKRNERYLRENIEDRSSRDPISRAAWFEKFYWLKQNAWWTFRSIQHWIHDYDYSLEMRELFGDPERGIEYIEWIFDGRVKKHSWGGGCRRESLRSDAEGVRRERRRDP